MRRLEPPVKGFISFELWARAFGLFLAFWAFSFWSYHDTILSLWSEQFSFILLGFAAITSFGAVWVLVSPVSYLAWAVLASGRYSISAFAPFLQSPETGVLNWLCVGVALYLWISSEGPKDQNRDQNRDQKRDQSPDQEQFWNRIRTALFLVLSAAYVYSSIYKLMTPTWLSGEASRAVFGGIYANSTGKLLAERLPDYVIQFATWAAVVAQLAMPLGWIGRRAFIITQISLLAMHTVILVGLDLGAVSMGMVFAHLLLFVYKPPHRMSLVRLASFEDNFRKIFNGR